MKIRDDFSHDAIIHKWQTKALQLEQDGDIEKYFSPHYSFYELLRLAGFQPKRFLPIIMADADECSKCGKEFDWENPKTTAYIPQFQGYAGDAMPKDERDLFLLDIDVLFEDVVCLGCQSEMRNRYLSLMCAAWAAARREALEEDQQSKTGA